MRSISTVIIFAALVCAALLTACASSEPRPKEPVWLDLSVNALPTVNPDNQGRAAPIAVRVYELKDAGTFKTADFFTLQSQDKTVLGEDLIKRDEWLLRPGDHQTIVRQADPATTSIGVVAAYRDLPNSVWRAVYPLPAAPDAAWYHFAPKLKLSIDLGANAIALHPQNK